MWAPIDQVTPDGYDMTWGTNTLGEGFPIVDGRTHILSALYMPGPFYFTKLLLPALLKASTPENKSRVVNTSSAGSMTAVSFSGSGLDFATFRDSPHRRKYSTSDLYGQSKLVRRTISVWFPRLIFSNYKGNVVFAQEFARRYADNIVTTAVHPGQFTRNICQARLIYHLSLNRCD